MDRVTLFWCLWFLSSCRRCFILAVLLPVADVHISARSHSHSLFVIWRPQNCASLDLECGPLLKWPFSVSSASSENCLLNLMYWSWNDRFLLWNRIFYQLKLLAFWSLVPCWHIAPLPNLASMLLHGLSVSLARLCSSCRILWDDTSWWPCLWHLSAGAHSMSCLHHCGDLNSFWVLSSKPSLGSPSLHKWGNKVLNLCNGMQLGCAPGSTLTSIIMVPALPGILMVTSVMISDLASGSVSVYSPSVGLLSALVLWAILLWTAKQENLLYVPSSSGPEGTVFDDTLPCCSLLPPVVVVTSDGTEFFIVTAYTFCFGGFFGVFFFWCWWLPPPLPL